MNKYITTIFVLIATFATSFGQQLLTKQMAVDLALENNYGIKIAKNNVEISKNNAEIFNSGFLPRISANAGATYNNNNSEFTTQSNVSSEINNAESKLYNASISANYTLFDGFGRSYNYKKLKENYNLTELETKTIIENSLLQIFTVYFEVARLTENNSNLKQSLAISKQRLERSKIAFEYGQNTKLQVLNAEVDVNNDSIRVITSERQLSNSKRDLNLFLGRNVSSPFLVETAVDFKFLFNYTTLLKKAKIQNTNLQKAQKNIEISAFDLKINESDLLPTLSLSSSYGINKYDNDATFNYANQLSKGLNAGLNLSWNIFDGGTTKTRIQNSKIILDNVEIQKEQLENELERTLANSLELYNNALFVLKSEEKNVETNIRNFQRTEEQFKLGQITSIEFRQAQINLLNAQSNVNEAKYDAKNAELKLLQLTGDLLTIEF
ncbi:TolC family protein [Lutibacter sp.]|uniref:TolC family protein n=1 Tax=Lutibacter sp. TaxID=1925666 RepID=UPI0027376A77|nr:TolC family protein [Lutibacter sp.]MDP3312879.1 TolC family protein [Lutibacter sp.]